MANGDQQDDSGLRESVDSFHRAGIAASNGFRLLYEGVRTWFERRNSVVRTAVVLSVWFGGNWTYNRVAPSLIEGTLTFLQWMSSEIETASTFAVLDNHSLFASIQVLTLLLSFIVAQNRLQTRKLKKVEDKLTTMTKETRGVADGGSRELPPTGPRAIGGAIAGGAIGISFGPGGLLAGILLGFIMGDRRDIRAYESDPHTPDLKVESLADSGTQEGRK